jgi:hypothetical protein
MTLTVSNASVVDEYEKFSSTSAVYLDQHRKIGGAIALSKNGALLRARSLF